MQQPNDMAGRPMSEVLDRLPMTADGCCVVPSVDYGWIVVRVRDSHFMGEGDGCWRGVNRVRLCNYWGDHWYLATEGQEKDGNGFYWDGPVYFHEAAARAAWSALSAEDRGEDNGQA